MARGTEAASPKLCHGACPSHCQPIPDTGMAGAGWGPGCSAFKPLSLWRGRELSAVKGPEWTACEVAGYG